MTNKPHAYYQKKKKNSWPAVCRFGFGVVQDILATRLCCGQRCWPELGMCLGWLRRTSDQPHRPPDGARPDIFCGCLPCWGYTLISLKCLTSLYHHSRAMVHAFLIHTLQAAKAEEGFCRVLYSCFFGAENSPNDPQPHSAERDRLLRKEQILAVAR